ncbi:hypothetical protein [Neisseria dumasiana]|nr:hypothetical protein [Neisseria dumasiana]UOO83348.1 hypothetical protein LVJ88_06350 [Neisseria dumasiana]
MFYIFKQPFNPYLNAEPSENVQTALSKIKTCPFPPPNTYLKPAQSP